MIRELSLSNFRAFRKKKFIFSKINVFVGPNNSGKSSALSALNLLAQSASDASDGVPIVLKGSHDDFGTFHDLIYHNTSRNVLGVKFTTNKFTFELKYRFRPQRREIDVLMYEISTIKDRVFSYKSSKDSYVVKYGGKTLEELGVPVQKSRPTFNGLYIDDESLRNVRRLFMSSRGEVDVSKDALLDLRRAEFRIREAMGELRSTFTNFDSLGPFREPPSRTYHFSGGQPRKIGKTGANAIDILVGDNFRRDKGKRKLVELVSKWFSGTSMASSVTVNPLTTRHYEICVKSENGRQYNLCDVGFGCSQVLPVLIGGANVASFGSTKRRRRGSPIFVVQEPEIHLHPNAQAELGSYFVDLINSGTQLFIETHSDNLLLRLQQHVAAGDVDNNDVSIFFVSREEGESSVEEMKMDEHGIFTKDWPGGFFPQRQIESRKLAQLTSKSKLKDAKSDNGSLGFDFEVK